MLPQAQPTAHGTIHVTHHNAPSQGRADFPDTHDEAKRIYDKLVAETTAKGYTPGEDGTQRRLLEFKSITAAEIIAIARST